MARKRIGSGGGATRIPVSGFAAKVREVAVDAARLMTIEVDPRKPSSVVAYGAEGAFVRLVGPRAACEDLRDKLLAGGALAVKIEATPEAAAPVREAPGVAPNEKIREVAMSIVEASSFAAKDALRAEVDRVLSGAGL